MSSLFGNPPPPKPHILEPRPGAKPPEPTYEYYYAPERSPGRRRAAVWLAFFAAAMLVFANLACWLHFSGTKVSQADVVATATFDDMTSALSTTLTGAYRTALSDPEKEANAGAGAVGDVTVNQPELAADITKATNAALNAPATHAAWHATVAGALEQQQAMLDGTSPSTDAISTSLDTKPITDAITADLKAQNYTFAPPEGPAIEDLTIVLNPATGSIAKLLENFASLWWLLVFLTVVLAVGAIAVATRRIRLATILALDAIFMLAGCLLLVPLMRSSAASRAADSNLSGLVENAYDAVTKSLVHQTLVLMVIAGILAVISFVIGQVDGRDHR